MPFRPPRFYPILDTAVLAERRITAIEAADALLDAGIKILQYRHKDPWKQVHFDEVRQLSRLCEAAGVLFVLNDRADYAALVHAALHLGQRDLPPLAARRVVNSAVIGFSTHSRAQLLHAQEEPVDYISIGPIYETTSKLKPDPVLGIKALETLCPLSSKPLVAIGGITLENAAFVLEQKADSVAVISALLPPEADAKAMREIAREWLSTTA